MLKILWPCHSIEYMLSLCVLRYLQSTSTEFNILVWCVVNIDHMHAGSMKTSSTWVEQLTWHSSMETGSRGTVPPGQRYLPGIIRWWLISPPWSTSWGTCTCMYMYMYMYIQDNIMLYITNMEVWLSWITWIALYIQSSSRFFTQKYEVLWYDSPHVWRREWKELGTAHTHMYSRVCRESERMSALDQTNLKSTDMDKLAWARMVKSNLSLCWEGRAMLNSFHQLHHACGKNY